MLELCTSLPILGDTCPIIRPRLVRTSSQANHRLYRECHTGFQSSNSFVLRVMRNVRRGMEQGVDTVTTVSLDYTEFLGLGVFLDDVSELLEGHIWFGMRNS